MPSHRHLLPHPQHRRPDLLKNADLRQALSLAINRQAICDTVYEGTRMPATASSRRVSWATQPKRLAVRQVRRGGGQGSISPRPAIPNGEGLPELTIIYNTGGSHEKV